VCLLLIQTYSDHRDFQESPVSTACSPVCGSLWTLLPALKPGILKMHVLFISYSRQMLAIPRESKLRYFPYIFLPTVGHNYSRPCNRRVASDGNEKCRKHEARNNLVLCLYRLMRYKETYLSSMCDAEKPVQNTVSSFAAARQQLLHWLFHITFKSQEKKCGCKPQLF
jgi:hypothetical protein